MKIKIRNNSALARSVDSASASAAAASSAESNRSLADALAVHTAGLERRYADALRRRVESMIERVVDWYDLERSRTHGRRGDASASVFIEQLMTQLVSRFFVHEYPDLKFANGGLVPVDSSLPETTKNFEWAEVGYHGDADFVDDDADDSPRADVHGSINPGRVRTIGTHFRLGRDELDTARQIGTLVSLAEEKAAAARLMMDTRRNTTICRGRAAFGFDGVTNARGMIIDAANTGTWTSASAANIVDDVRRFVSAMIEGAKGTSGHMIDSAIFPIATWTRITMLQFSAASEASVLDVLKRYCPFIKTWEWDANMSTVSPAGGPAVLFYKNDSDVVRTVEPRGVRFLPEEPRGRAFIVNADQRYGGLIVQKPLAMGLMTGI